MDELFWRVALGWVVVSDVRLIWFLAWSKWFWSAVGVWFAFLAPLNDRYIEKTAHEYPQTLTLLSAKPDITLLDDGSTIPTVTLDIRSTYLRPFDPKAVVCVISGPVYYAPDQGFIYSGAYRAAHEDGDLAYYLGVRQMTVHLVLLGYLPADHNDDATILPAAARDFFFEPTSPIDDTISYVIAEPWRLLPDDTVERCKIGEHITNVADIQASMKWVGADAGSLDMLRTRDIGANIAEQVRAAYRRLYGLALDDGGA